MTTKQVNLISNDRRQQRLMRRAMQRWLVLTFTYSMVVVLLWATYAGTGAVQYRALANEVALADTDAITAKASLNQARRQFADSMRRRTVVTAIRERPDWSLLLRALGDAVGNKVVLNEVTLVPLTSKKADQRVMELQFMGRDEYTLSVKGIAVSQLAASQFTLRLQQNGLFGTIKTTRSNRETYGAVSGIGFELQCPIPEGNAAK